MYENKNFEFKNKTNHLSIDPHNSIIKRDSNKYSISDNRISPKDYKSPLIGRNINEYRQLLITAEKNGTKEEFDRLKKMIAVHEEDLFILNQENSNLSKENKRLKIETNRLKDELLISDENQNSLKEENLNLLRKIKENKRKHKLIMKELEAKYIPLIQNFNEIKIDCISLTKDSIEDKNEIDFLKNELQSLSFNYNKCVDELNIAKTQILELKIRKSDIFNINKSEIDKLNSENKILLEKEINRNQLNIQEIQKEMHELSKEWKTQSNKFESAEKEKKNTENQNKFIEDKIKQVQSSNQVIEEKVESILEQVKKETENNAKKNLGMSKYINSLVNKNRVLENHLLYTNKNYF